MKFAEKQHFLRTIESYGLRADELDAYGDADGAAGKATFSVPLELSRALPFSKLLLALSAPQQSCLIMPTEWGVWPSSENRHLYELLRRANNDAATLSERPCHCFSSDEMELALDFVYLFVAFSWDFYVFSYRQDDILFVSHDSFATYYSPSRIEALAALIERDHSEVPSVENPRN